MQVLKYFDVLVDHMQSVMYSADVSFTLLQDMVCVIVACGQSPLSLSTGSSPSSG